MILAAIVLSPLVLYGAVLVAQSIGGRDMWRFGLLLGIIIVALFSMVRTPRFMRVRKYMQDARTAANAVDDKGIRIAVELSEVGVRYKWDDIESIIPWKLFTEVVDEPGFIALAPLNDAVSPIAIPAEAFGDRSHRDVFTSHFRRSLAGVLPGGASALASYLATFDIPYPSRGYSLFNCAHTACPECGISLSFTMIRFWNATRVFTPASATS